MLRNRMICSALCIAALSGCGAGKKQTAQAPHATPKPPAATSATPSQAANPYVDQVRAVAAKLMEKPVSDFPPNARFAQDLGWDSLDMAEFIMEVEDTFQVTVSDADEKHFTTPENAAAWVAKHVKK